MSTKEIAIKSIQNLPEDATWEQIQEKINFVAGVGKGFCELDEDKGVSHERVKEEITKWLSS